MTTTTEEKTTDQMCDEIANICASNILAYLTQAEWLSPSDEKTISFYTELLRVVRQSNGSDVLSALAFEKIKQIYSPVEGHSVGAST